MYYFLNSFYFNINPHLLLISIILFWFSFPILTGGAFLDKLLAIFDTDILYASRLMEYLKKSAWEGYEVLLFTKVESLIDFLEYQPVEILLYGGEENLHVVKNCKNVKYLFCFSSNKKLIKNKSLLIYKYQSAPDIMRDIISLYTKLEDSKDETTYGDVRIISVFSPIPSIEKIEFSWSLAKDLSNRVKVLFIPLEFFPTCHMFHKDDKGQSLSDFLYYLKDGKNGSIDKIKSYLSYSEKLSYLSGINHGFDLLSVSKEDIERLVESIKEHKDYEMVIFYIGIYTEAAMEILKSSDEVCIAICEDNYEEIIREEWERQMDLLKLHIIEKKHHIIRIPTKAGENEKSGMQVAKEIAKEIVA